MSELAKLIFIKLDHHLKEHRWKPSFSRILQRPFLLFGQIDKGDEGSLALLSTRLLYLSEDKHHVWGARVGSKATLVFRKLNFASLFSSNLSRTLPAMESRVIPRCVRCARLDHHSFWIACSFRCRMLQAWQKANFFIGQAGWAKWAWCTDLFFVNSSWISWSFSSN